MRVTVNHQWPHDRCQCLHPMLICPGLHQAAGYSAPHNLASMLPPGTVKLIADLGCFLGRKQRIELLNYL